MGNSALFPLVILLGLEDHYSEITKTTQKFRFVTLLCLGVVLVADEDEVE